MENQLFSFHEVEGKTIDKAIFDGGHLEISFLDGSFYSADLKVEPQSVSLELENSETQYVLHTSIASKQVLSISE